MQIFGKGRGQARREEQAADKTTQTKEKEKPL